MPLLYLSLERPQKNIKENKGKIYSPMASLYMLKPLKTKTLKTFMKSRGINDSKLKSASLELCSTCSVQTHSNWMMKSEDLICFNIKVVN